MAGTVSRNERCPCGSGRKFKRCCQQALDHPDSIARQHSAVGHRIQDWASEQFGEEMAAAFHDVVGGREGVVLGEGDLQLIGTWALNERELPDGSTIARRYACQSSLEDEERDVATRIAAARLTLLRIDGVAPGRSINARDLAIGEQLAISSQDASRSLKPGDLIVGRLMAGPPAATLWGPVAIVDRVSGPQLSEFLSTQVRVLGLETDPRALAVVIAGTAREITALVTPALRESQALPRAA